MPITDFQGDTFVAFADISGFKAMMTDGNRGAAALDTLYSTGYAVISEQPRNAFAWKGYSFPTAGYYS